jgi:endonuclease G
MTMLEAASVTQQEAVDRVRKRTGQRQHKIEAITTGRLVLADEPIRIASRIERLSRYYPSVRPVSPAVLVANDPNAVQAAGAVLERIINTPDFVDVRYLEAGTRSAHAVGRVDVRDHAGRVLGFGTGSMVTARLLLTNQWLSRTASIEPRSAAALAGPVVLWEADLQPKVYLRPGASKVGSVSSRHPSTSSRTVGPPMWVRRTWVIPGCGPRA